MAAKLIRLTHKIAIQLHLYHLQFSLQAASPGSFGFTVICAAISVCNPEVLCDNRSLKLTHDLKFITVMSIKNATSTDYLTVDQILFVAARC
jgi:hypothetical protein